MTLHRFRFIETGAYGMHMQCMYMLLLSSVSRAIMQMEGGVWQVDSNRIECTPHKKYASNARRSEYAPESRE